MSSREIAALVESRHTDVCRTIERLMASQVIKGYAPTAYTHEQNGQRYTEYLVGKRDSYIIVAQLSPEFTARLVDRWQELEAGSVIRIPRTLPEALRLAADQAEEIERQAAALTAAAPKIEFVDRYVDAVGNKGFREVAKLLRANEREFREFLVDRGILYRLGGALTPAAPHLDAGRFVVKAGASDSGHAFNQAKFTPKGVTWIAGEWGKYMAERNQDGEAA